MSVQSIMAYQVPKLIGGVRYSDPRLIELDRSRSGKHVLSRKYVSQIQQVSMNFEDGDGTIAIQRWQVFAV
jgi:hypothetical protein